MPHDSPNPLAGTTRTERLLSEICKETFLSLWSFPNVYKDQGKKGESGTGKEVCDLLVVFGDRVIIFSDKYCVFPSSGTIDQRWNRWQRRAVQKSASQLFGAKRWIENHPTRLFTDPHCLNRLPIDLGNIEKLKFHLVAVANGATEACRKHFKEIRGTLVISPSSTVSAGSDDLESPPFFVGQPNLAKGVVHVLDDEALQIVLRELDTVQDLVDYFDAKEKLLGDEKLLSAAGEEELLAVYIKNRYLGKDEVFGEFYKFDHVTFDIGFWDSLIESPEYHAKKKRDIVSYNWDRFIESLVGGLEANESPGSDSRYEKEFVLRKLAEHTRFERRFLSETIIDLLSKPVVGAKINTRTFIPDQLKTGYVFVAAPLSIGNGKAEYHERRHAYLEIYCEIVGSDYPGMDYVIGIATEANELELRTHDVYVFDNSDWPEGRYEEIQTLRSSIGLFNQSKLQMVRRRPLEFPRVGPGHPRPGRNAPCPCGSGKKYKKCCLFNQ